MFLYKVHIGFAAKANARTMSYSENNGKPVVRIILQLVQRSSVNDEVKESAEGHSAVEAMLRDHTSD